jgi:hypothetical protein
MSERVEHLEKTVKDLEQREQRYEESNPEYGGYMDPMKGFVRFKDMPQAKKKDALRKVANQRCECSSTQTLPPSKDQK